MDCPNFCELAAAARVVSVVLVLPATTTVRPCSMCVWFCRE